MSLKYFQANIGGSEVKNPPVIAGDSGWIPGLGRSPAGGNGNLLQYCCLENSIDRGAWAGEWGWGGRDGAWLQSMGLQKVGHN